MFGWVVFLLIVGSLIVLTFHWRRRENEAFKQVVEETNQKHGTNFVISGTTTLGGAFSQTSIVFDPKSRKLLLYSGKRRYVLRDYSYLRGWKLLWIETSTSNGIRFKNIRFEFQTSNLNQPLFYIPMTSKSAADAWNHRLDLLLNG